MRTKAIAAVAVAFTMSTAHAGEPVPVKLDPIDHEEAVLVIVGSDGTSATYTPEDLETFSTYSMTTTTPWREKEADFEGVLLSDLLAKHGLDGVDSILVTAENDYTTTMERALLDSVQILVATRVDGKPHSRRARGPIQFVIDSQAYAASDLTSESNFVWMASRIEVDQ